MSKKEPFLARIKPIWPLVPAAIYLSTFFFIVLFYLVAISFGTDGTFPSLDAARKVFAYPEFHKAFVNTFVFALIGTPLELIVGVFLAMLVFKAYYAQGFLKGVFIMPFAFPGLVVAALLFILFDSSGGFINHLIQGQYPIFPKIWFWGDINWRGNHYFALGLSLFGKIWRDMPIAMLIILSGLNAIDQQLLDAAQTLGAGFRQRFTKVVLPLLFPAMTTVLLLRSVEMWKEFIFPYVLAKKTHLLGTLIDYLYISSLGQREGEAAVVGFVLVVGVVLTLLFIISIMTLLKRWLVDPGVDR